MMPARLTKPISDTDRNGTEYHSRRSDGISLHSRKASSKDALGSASAIISASPPAALRSWPPRTGSRNRNAAMAKITVGMKNTKNGVRQLPVAAASPPARRGPANCPSTLAPRWIENTDDRRSTA